MTLIQEYSLDIPTFNEMHTLGLNLDKAVAFLFGHSALATYEPKTRKIVLGSVSSAKRLREAGAIRVNGTVYRDVRYRPTAEDVGDGFFTIAVGKPSSEGGAGYEMPVAL